MEHTNSVISFYLLVAIILFVVTYIAVRFKLSFIPAMLWSTIVGLSAIIVLAAGGLVSYIAAIAYSIRHFPDVAYDYNIHKPLTFNEFWGAIATAFSGPYIQQTMMYIGMIGVCTIGIVLAHRGIRQRIQTKARAGGS